MNADSLWIPIIDLYMHIYNRNKNVEGNADWSVTVYMDQKSILFHMEKVRLSSLFLSNFRRKKKRRIMLNMETFYYFAQIYVQIPPPSFTISCNKHLIVYSIMSSKLRFCFVGLLAESTFSFHDGNV